MAELINENFDFDHPWSSLAILGAGIIFSVLIHIILVFFTRKVLLRKDDGTNAHLIRQEKRPTLFLFISIALGFLLPATQFKEPTYGHIYQAIILFFIFSLAWVMINLLGVIQGMLISNYDIEAKDNLRARKVTTQLRVFRRILIFVIIVIALSSALMTFEKIRQVGVNLLASAGIAGIIIGFAAQKSLATILAGFQIAITQPIRLDDVVIVEREWGWIEEIALTYVVIRIWDKRRLIVPITYFIEKPFENWTRVSADILGTVYIYTDYTTKVDAIRKELTKILNATPLWDKKVNVLQVTNATEKSMELRALMSAPDSPTAWDLRVLVREKLIGFLQNNHPKALPRTRVELEKNTGLEAT